MYQWSNYSMPSTPESSMKLLGRLGVQRILGIPTSNFPTYASLQDDCTALIKQTIFFLLGQTTNITLSCV
jgi:hypothetical protein